MMLNSFRPQIITILYELRANLHKTILMEAFRCKLDGVGIALQTFHFQLDYYKVTLLRTTSYLVVNPAAVKDKSQ